ncbi:MAG: lipopolysaccharide kinase InaA family protein [Planctomycetota bacterium]
MLELKNIYPDLIIPSYFHINESHKEWRIIHHDYESGVNSLFDGKIDVPSAPMGEARPFGRQLATTVKGRGEYIVAHIKSASGQNEEVIMKTYKRGGLTALFLPDIFNDARRPLNELVLTEKARVNGVSVSEILGIQIKWITPFLFRAKIISKKIPDTITLEDFILFLLKNYKDKYSELYQKKKNLIESISRAIGQLHQVGIYHSDLNIRNILIQSPEGTIKTYIIDLDKSYYEQPLSFDKRVDNLIRLNRSLEKMIFKFKSLNINNIVTYTDRLLLLETCFNELSLGGKDQKRSVTSRCLRHTRLHKWWWRLYRSG